MDSGGHPKTLSSQKLLAFVLLQVILSLTLFAYIRISTRPEAMQNVQKNKPPVTLPAPPPAPSLTILMWKWPYDEHFDIPDCFKLLGIPSCHITGNHSWYSKADAVLVHHRDVSSSPKKLPPEPRPPSQRWIWFNMESPSYSLNLHFMDNRFNFTMSYRRDSDIFTPYGWVEVLPEGQNFILPAKSKLVAWVVSNWNPSSWRVKYYNELKEHLSVDVYGRSHLHLPRAKHLSTISQYKFYLSFENSIHEDYITEKFWKNALLSTAIPVVLGPPRKNYERYLPPDAFIHVEDFPDARALAGFLLQLDKNATRYQEYFRWRLWLKPSGRIYWGFYLCKACQFLQMKPLRYQAVSELSKWFK